MPKIRHHQGTIDGRSVASNCGYVIWWPHVGLVSHHRTLHGARWNKMSNLRVPHNAEIYRWSENGTWELVDEQEDQEKTTVQAE